MRHALVIFVFFAVGVALGFAVWAPALAWFSLPNGANAASVDVTSMLGFVLNCGLLFVSVPVGVALRGLPPLSPKPTILYLLLGGLVSGLVAYYFHALHMSTATLATRLGGKGALTLHMMPIARIPLIGAAFVFVTAGTQRLLAAAKPVKES
jgi:hypothetical protein